MTDLNEFNRRIIDEFRADGGKVGGQFEGATLLLLHTTGARSGAERVNPVVYRALGEDFVVFGSRGGADTHPDWYHNLRAAPEASVEVGTETVAVTSRVAEGEERKRSGRPRRRSPGLRRVRGNDRSHHPRRRPRARPRSVIALVTGANRGIGLEVVRQLARRGDTRAPGCP